MNRSLPTPAATPPLRRFGDLQQILQALRQLSVEARRPLPGQRELLRWLQGRERNLARARIALQRDAGVEALINDWLAHAPTADLSFVDAGCSLALRARVAALENHLIQLFGTLLQHSDSIWVRELYFDLLDNRAPLSAEPASGGHGLQPC